VPLKGLAPRNTHVPVAAPARGGERVDLLVEAAANPTVLGGAMDEWGAFSDFRPNRLDDQFQGSVVVGKQGALDGLAGEVVVPDRGG
jgi:hypothetical protein